MKSALGWLCTLVALAIFVFFAWELLEGRMNQLPKLPGDFMFSVSGRQRVRFATLPTVAVSATVMLLFELGRFLRRHSRPSLSGK